MQTAESNPSALPVRGSGWVSHRNQASLVSDLLPLCDLVCLFLAASAGNVLFQIWQGSLVLAAGVPPGLGQAGVIALVLVPFILYDRRFGLLATQGATLALMRSHALRWVVFAGVVLALDLLSQPATRTPFGWLAIWLATGAAATTLARVVAAVLVRGRLRLAPRKEVVAVVGTGPVADRLVQSLRGATSRHVEVLGVFDDKVIGAAPSVMAASGNLAQLIELGKSRPIDWIVLTLPPSAAQRLIEITQRLGVLDAPIGLCAQDIGQVGHAPLRAVVQVGGQVPVHLLATRPLQHAGALLKTAEDFLLGGMLCLLLAPVFLLVALAIRLDGPGPLIFRQRRHTLDNREFWIYKFRTMHWHPANAVEGLQQTLRSDARVTRVGRFLRASSLDELPQLLNVIKGDMSLVGPRPHAVDMRTENQLGHEITAVYPHRHRVKPGMTGWAQVNGARGATNTTAQLQRRVELDLHYIDHWSLLLDLKILALTSREVIKRTNAF